jgi:hypothetical protein
MALAEQEISRNKTDGTKKEPHPELALRASEAHVEGRTRLIQRS